MAGGNGGLQRVRATSFAESLRTPEGRETATFGQTADLARAAAVSRNVSVAVASLGLLVSVIVVILLVVHGG